MAVKYLGSMFVHKLYDHRNALFLLCLVDQVMHVSLPLTHSLTHCLIETKPKEIETSNPRLLLHAIVLLYVFRAKLSRMEIKIFCHIFATIFVGYGFWFRRRLRP